MTSLDDLLSAASSFSLVSEPGGGAVSFASPSVPGGSPASVEGVVRGADSPSEGTGALKRCFSVVLVRGFDRSLCFGAVGSGNASFCIRKDCKIKSHAENKAEGIDNLDSFYFIARVPGATVFSEPNVKEAQVPKETRDEWKDKAWTLPKWVRAFRAITIADDVEASNEDIKKESKLLSDADRFKTPSKKRKAKTETDDTEPLVMVSFEPHERSLPEDGAPELETFISSLAKGGLSRIVARLESSVVGVGRALEEIATLTHRRFVENEENVHLVSGAVQNLISVLGPTVEMGEKFEAPTLWGTTAFVGNEVEQTAEEVSHLKVQLVELKTSVSKIMEEKTSQEESSSEANGKMLKILSLVTSRVQAFTPEIAQVRNLVLKLESEMSLSNARSPKRQRQTGREANGDDDAMDDLMTMLTSNASVKDHPPSTGFSHDKDFPSEDDQSLFLKRVGEIKADVSRMSTEMRMIISDVGLLKACAEDKSIKFGGLGLRTLQECHEWITSNFRGLRYGLVMDPLLMLDRIFGSDDVEAESQFKILESRVKLKITTGAEAAAIKALHFNRPRLFHKGRVAMTSERNTSKLSKLPTFKSWKSGGEGVRNYVTKQMNLISSTVAHDISYAFGSDPELAQAQAVATSSLNATITFLTQLMGFIDTIYEKLHLHSKFSADQAWSLTTQILDRVCEDLYAPKEGVAAAMTVEDPVSICSHLLWSCFRTHDVMAEYIDYNFENHPAISAEYVKFLATNSGYDKVEKMEVMVLNMKENVTKALDMADKAKKSGESATDKFSAAHKEIESLKKRVQYLEGKGNK